MTNDSTPQDSIKNLEQFDGEIKTSDGEELSITDEAISSVNMSHLKISEDFDGEIQGAVPNEKLEKLVDELEKTDWSGWSRPRDGANQAADRIRDLITKHRSER